MYDKQDPINGLSQRYQIISFLRLLSHLQPPPPPRGASRHDADQFLERSAPLVCKVLTSTVRVRAGGTRRYSYSTDQAGPGY